MSTNKITFILDIARIYDYLDFSNEDTKLLFWAIHPLNILHVHPKGTKLQNLPLTVSKNILKILYRSKFNRMKSIILELNSYKACHFMDYENLSYQNHLFDIDLQKEYLPVSCPAPNIEAPADLVRNGEINICVVGRLVKEKVYPLINVLDNLVNYETKNKKIVHIIGDGDSKYLIKDDKYKNKIEIKYTGTIKDVKDLHTYLKSNADIVFAMGTSVIEASAMKIPAIIFPYSYKPINNTKFMYFFEAFEYQLGINIDFYKKIAKHEFPTIMDDIYKKKNKKLLGEKCHNYYIQNHSVETTAEKLLKKINEDALTYKLYKEIIQK